MLARRYWRKPMRPCPTCGIILDIACQYNGSSRHMNRCKASSVAERTYFKAKGHWPGKKIKLHRLPPEVPEAPPVA